MDQVRPAKVPFPLRIEQEKLDRLREIADRNNRTLVGHIRQLIDNELAAEEQEMDS